MKSFATTRRPASLRSPVRRASLPFRSAAESPVVRNVLHGPRLQPKLTVGPPDDAYEREADRVADAVMRMPAPDGRVQRVCAECEEEMQRQPAPEEEEKPLRRQTTTLEKAASPLGGLPPELRTSMERAFDADFSEVKVHVAARADSIGADAFTSGSEIHFAPGRYAPASSQGRELIAHELVHVVQQRSGRVAATRQAGGIAVNESPALEAEADHLGAQAAHQERVGSGGDGSPAGARPAPPVRQFSNPADRRLPATQAEALADATAADAEITAAVARLGASAVESEHNISDYIGGQGLVLRPLTPRHDSTVGDPNIRFFPGHTDYTGSYTLPDTVTHWVRRADRTQIDIRARDHADVDTMLPAAEVQRRVVQAVSESSEARAGAHPAVSVYDIYRGRFNSWWNVAPFAGQSTAYDPTIATSRGPRSVRSRNIFERIDSEDSVFAAAYDANTDGVRDRVDIYMGPESRNPFSSPRLQALRAAFFAHPVPVTTLAEYNLLKTDVQAASAPLTIDDRQAVSISNEWQALIAKQCDTQPRRDEILRTITTVPAAAGGGGAPPVVLPGAGPPAGGAVTPQQFLDGAFIDGPTAPVHAKQRVESVPLTPKSPNPNPGVTVNSQITVTPANRVRGTNVSPQAPWPNAAVSGSPFTVDIHNTGTVTMTARLDLLGEPAGLTPAHPATLAFDVVDDRRTFFLANWFPVVTFAEPGSRNWYVTGRAGVTIRYAGGGQPFEIYGYLPAGSVNPGLPFSISGRALRGGVEIVAPQTTVYPADRQETATIHAPVNSPAVVPPGGDPLVFEVKLLDADGVTVLGTKTVAMSVLAEAVFTQAQAEAAAVADRAFIRGNGPTELLGLMTAAGGMKARFASAVNSGAITLEIATLRHDSAGYITDVRGGPDASQKALFEGPTYGLVRPDPHTKIIGADVLAYSTPNKVWLIRTMDVAAGTTRTDADLMDTAFHEGVHALDPRAVPYAFNAIERYRREFRAYWMAGGYGPPDQPLCLGAAGCFDAVVDPTMAPPGPKSPRARQIFEQLYRTYSYVKPPYDANTDGFRDIADNYHHPDGINLMLSPRLDELNRHVAAGITATFADFERVVQSYMGIVAPPPASGALDADEKAYIRRNRAWRDLVDLKVPLAHRAAIKADLGIP